MHERPCACPGCVACEPNSGCGAVALDSGDSACRPGLTLSLVAVVLLVVLVVATTGCAVKPLLPLPITDLKQVAGVWEGWVIAREGAERFRVQLAVRPDGQYTWVVLRGGTSVGTMRIVDGALQWGLWRGQTWFPSGTITVVEERSTQYLTWTRSDGVLLAEFGRPNATPR
jgi:hypothetical protein